MSHWRKFEADVLKDINKDLLAKAVKDLGVEMNESIKNIRNTWGNETVSAGLVKDGRPIALGFNFKNRNGKVELELSGDFFGTGLDERTFIDRLAQAYQKHNAIEKLEMQGWNIDEMNVNDKGEIVIEAYQWA
ncbi:DUF1257 domain-containing protein [Heyndrickxia sporothermodurans]|uniref:DUF1257 domain-containing protein n=1 Tax=Heyndrickxia sporothermodurans TaxID=46224 RepID=UPI000D395837|nr:DUF1257 domain-containing protein [Heyndrickxia sporothermodurans]PTY93000.1 hypothetical protein B5V90_02655 [Heyndrickxia sporothermodurans]